VFEYDHLIYADTLQEAEVMRDDDDMFAIRSPTVDLLSKKMSRIRVES
jgi:hypothetical protein